METKKKEREKFLSILLFSGLAFFSMSFFSSAQDYISSDKNIFLDSDQDNLSDSEEKAYGTDPHNPDTDGDGYSDGVEIKSGYNPLKPAPGDKIVKEEAKKVTPSATLPLSDDEGENLTKQVAIETSNLITQKNVEKKEITLEDLDSIVQKVVGEELTLEDLPEIEEGEIKIKKQKYSKLNKEEKAEREKKDSQEYLLSISYILLANSPRNISSYEDLKNFSSLIMRKFKGLPYSSFDVSYFEDLAKQGEKALEQIREVEVPEKHLDLHKKGLKIAKFAASLKDSAKPDPGDPIKTITGLARVQSLINLSTEYLMEVYGEFSNLEVVGLPIKF